MGIFRCTVFVLVLVFQPLAAARAGSTDQAAASAPPGHAPATLSPSPPPASQQGCLAFGPVSPLSIGTFLGQIILKIDVSAPAVFQWLHDDAEVQNGLGVSGADTNTLKLSGIKLIDAGIYRLVATDVCGTITSSDIELLIRFCDGDSDADGLITLSDITDVLTSWGLSYRPSSGPGDSDNNGIVDFADVTAVFRQWESGCMIP